MRRLICCLLLLLMLPAAALGESTAFTPNSPSPYYGQDASLNYWTLPMDITDTEKVWQVLTAPITVVNDGKGGVDQHKRQLTLYEEANTSSKKTGVVTNLTQGVHVLRYGKEWSYVECYSSSFHNSRVKKWNALVQGYIQTKYLTQVMPDQHLGFVVDKLTQRLYVFMDGELYDTLLCSTGLVNSSQPYNETRSGEFLLQTPAVGPFPSGNLTCEYGIRFNGGDILHEIPHLTSSSGKFDYTSTERALGQRASHGCIRIQRRKTPKESNMKWIWDNRRDEMKLLIWEDWQGRQIPYPDAGMTLYLDPDAKKSNRFYHTAAHCFYNEKMTYSPVTYEELHTVEAYITYEKCTWCAAPWKRDEIDRINQKYIPEN